jgi:hypothetical protein
MRPTRLLICLFSRVPSAKIFSFSSGPNHLFIHRHPVPHERGVSRSSRTLGAGSDGRGCALDEQHGGGRRSRVVLTPRRWRQVDGAIRQRWWQESPVTKESSKETVTPSRREGRVTPCEPVVDYRVLTTLCTRGCGCAVHPVFPAPSLEGRAAPSLEGRAGPSLEGRAAPSLEGRNARFFFNPRAHRVARMRNDVRKLDV